jgi:OmpA-OmpF porin, OOP family
MNLCLVASSAAQDTSGREDHPLVSRYAGSTLVAYDEKSYDAFTLVLGPERIEGGKRRAERVERVEGKVTRIVYVGPPGRSSLEVFRNYRDAFEKAGFDILYSCSGAECGRNFRAVVYPSDRQMQMSRPGAGALSTNVRDIHYLAARGDTKDGAVYASLMVAFHNARKDPNVLLEIVETTAMDTEMVTVTADVMAKSLESSGRVALYGIYFDTNSAEIKAESGEALREIGTLLKDQPALTLAVVGHTDTQGGYDFNMDLSRRRAEAVVNALVSDHGIQASRLRAAGVGYLAPVASNDTEDGRAKNRRVELVKQ